MILAVIISVGVPLAVLVALRFLQVYRTSATWLVVITVAWGALCTRLAIPFNDRAVEAFGFSTTTVWIAPIVEEILKALVLAVVVRSRHFTWFVDGAVYGFAVGTGFAAIENLLYVEGVGPDAALSTAIARVFSTALMHAAAAALIGVAVGFGKFAGSWRRGIVVLAGTLTAILLHGGFNWLVDEDRSVTGATVVALGGLGVVAGCVLVGTRRQRTWLVANLGVGQGVSTGELRLVATMDDLRAALSPFTDRYGRRDTDLAVELIEVQSRLGLAVRARDLAGDSTPYDGDVFELRGRADELRRELGVFRMSHLRTLVGERLDVEALASTGAVHADLAGRLEAEARDDTVAGSVGGGLWATLSQRTDSPGAVEARDHTSTDEEET